MKEHKYNSAEHLTQEQKQKQGAFYTPESIALKMAALTKWVPGQTVLDPCVGTGNLLQAMKDTYPELTNESLYGIDIDPKAIEICKEKFPGGHFVVANILNVDPANDDLWNDTENYINKKEGKYKSKFNTAGIQR